MRRELVISSELKNIEKVRFFLKQVFEEACIDKKLFNKVLLGLSEAVSNAMIHGNGLNCDKNVSVFIYLADDLLVVEVHDEGSGFFQECVSDPTTQENLRKEHGRGIFLIRNVADNVAYFNGGRCIEIKYNLSR